jgi:hypothetical protein
VLEAHVRQVVQVDLVRLALEALARQVAPVGLHVQVVPAAAQVSHAQVALRVPVAAQVFLAQAVAVALRVAVVAAQAVEQLELSVKAAAAAKVKPASQSVRNAKSSNKEVHRALVAQLCHAETVAPAFVCAAVLAFKTLPTRLTAMPVS